MANNNEKIAAIFQPMLNTLETHLRDHITLEVQKVLVEMKTHTTKLETVEKLASGAKKPTVRTTTKTETVAAENTTGDVQVAPSKAKSAVPTNKMLYFRNNWRDDEAFRTKYKKFVTQELEDEMANDATIKAKKTPDLKLLAEGHFLWIKLRENKEFLDMASADYDKFKTENTAQATTETAAVELKNEPATPK